ncbi:MAG: prolyl aminopeptidase [Spirochaetales bacterium]|nr:prolyl aminopeptidase [Leptospiraceae bacterium]MCP5482490.1 prolyl aminopeptidase [Spirochaetales bacterium]MCP5485806.1 prolyl aminopeptidase [Spirochaetales bacterium]
MRELYPPIEPFRRHTIAVSDLHSIYVEECGNAEARKILFLHGGPGGGIQADYRRFFDPARWHVILFDQRGCGRSTPCAELRENTTWDLVSDIETIRTQLEIERWTVFGGSWGSTLALAYAETHPERVAALILRGVFLGRRLEVDWLYQNGASRIFPDVWEQFIAPIPPEERQDMLSAYFRQLTSDDQETQIRAARAWSMWEGMVSTLLPDPARARAYGEEQFARAFARLECHYFVNNCFLSPEDQLLKNADRLRNIPGIILHGRYDIVCPAENAWELQRVWPEARLEILDATGHSAMEPALRARLVEVTDEFASR